jgi:murein DD-endopeptidase MepM/ murein hydrolase activator NlpD
VQDGSPHFTKETNSEFRMIKKVFFSILLSIILLASLAPTSSVKAQASGPTYIVQPGDTLNSIAGRFGVSLNDLISANNITDPNNISTGQPLIIPGLEGVTGTLTTRVIPLGENLETLTREYKIKPSTFIQLNRITSPSELYAGASLIIPVENDTPPAVQFSNLAKSQTLLEFAAAMKANPWEILLSNQLDSSTDVTESDHILLPSNSSVNGSSLVSPYIKSITVSPLPLIQGATIEIKLSTAFPMQLSGSLNGVPLNFFLQADGSYISLQGIHAMSTIGLSQFEILGNDKDGHQFAFNQMLLLGSGNFGKDPALEVDPATIDPANTKPEDDLVKSIVSKITNSQLWQGQWQYPIDQPICIKSGYGNRRSYNGSDYTFFHTGLDFGVCAPSLNIYAASSGVVVFAGALTIRGNATIINHGMGVFSAYYHQSEIKVKVGDTVTKGQLIGLIGETGRVTGPHLHFEVWVNGIQVQPIDWLENIYP